MNVPTPHIEARAGEFAKTVLMPGDPLRSRMIAQNFLQDAKLVNNVRGVQGYTGTYRGKPVSVMSSGMGMPSMGIYSYELYHYYDVERIIRIGTAGALSDTLQLREVVFALGTCTDSHFASQYSLPGTFAPTASYSLLKKAECAAQRLGITARVGNVLSTDRFYDDSQRLGEWKKMGVLAVEMEAAGLYLTAARAGTQALCMCTISDRPFTGESCTSEERQQSFTQMIEIALETAVEE